MITTGSRESFARARSAIAAAASATASQVARSSQPARVASARASRRAAACRRGRSTTSTWPWRQARPKLSVISTAGAGAARRGSRAASRRRARILLRGGVGVARQQHERVRRRPLLEASTPALAHTKPWRVRQMSTPRSRAQHLRGLVEHDLHGARVLALGAVRRAARPRARARARRDARRRARRRRPRTSIRPCVRSPPPARRRAARSPSAATISAARSSPARDLGDAAEAAC